ncbi:hypothetical protein [Streptomyces mayteni]
MTTHHGDTSTVFDEDVPVLEATITLEPVDGSPARTATGPVRADEHLADDLLALAARAAPA